MKISHGLRLPPEQYLPDQFAKDLIVLHHTSGGSARSTFLWWLEDPRRIGTAYMVERDGAIYEVFSPDSWAYHIGLKSHILLEKRSIGIELCSEGGLIERGGRLYCFDRISERTEFSRTSWNGKHDLAVDLGLAWRGYRWFAAYEEAQIEATVKLVDYLIDRFGISRRRHKPGATVGVDGPVRDAEVQIGGIQSHADLRPDKTDVHLKFPWERLGLHV